ncbi:polyketide cyclase [Streptomyces pluripotens]|uniref:Polyketide cyclase n=1 Tax=Streptomyces pluripotens TaxID=1355015 RepID=A0A221NUF4_9ACTN|nr:MULTISPECIES: SRPBCC family protein [Streptomyces]ARP69322.1 polyketide cyclase [Streptomyces pluripotens]ASN23580.1 polyketide cyclase [Streptomyces pluripotens]KIE28387.1 polyketide cyclase [Streptomyces sp. MUSC 125]MCH0555262.1 SRPBCC family protein [Streptomyces sp. MUM 16J]
MDWTRYRFRSLWLLPAPPATVYAVLDRPEDYPRWWPQVREVRRLDHRTGVIVIRSVLPYTMTFTARAVHREPAAGVLQIDVTGDIEGWIRWTVTTGGPGTCASARYDQEVRVHKPLLRRFAVPGRLVFRANHRLMMRAGRRGLLRHLQAV